MTVKLTIRNPGAELVQQYRATGMWVDSTLGQELWDGLLRNPDMQYRVWSDLRPFDGTFSTIHQRARRLAQSLRAMGVNPGDSVSFQLPNWIEGVEVFLALMFVGAVAVPIVHIYGSKELGFVLAQTETKIHITAIEFRHLDYRSTMVSLRKQLPALEQVIFIEEDYSKLLDAEPIEQIEPIDPDAPAIIAYTSGTTSNPKGVIHTHRTIVAEIRQRFVRDPDDTRPIPLEPPKGFEKWLVASPIGHVTGLQTGVLFPVMLNRPGHLIDRWDVEVVLDVLAQADLTLGGAATFFFNSLIHHPKFTPDHLRHVRYLASGGAPVPRAFGEECDAMGISVTRCYGSTEHPSVTGSSFFDDIDKRIGTDGRALSGVEIELRDSDGKLVPQGMQGEIHTRGPDLFVGYVDATLNEHAFDPEGWFCTGDVGVMDADGYLTITDRTKDIIIRGGENISAAEVEEALQSMDVVMEVAAVAAPDERMGEHVCVFIRAIPGTEAPTMPELREHLTRIGIARQKWPEEIRIVDDFDRTPSGKIKKFELRNLLRKAAQPAKL